MRLFKIGVMVAVALTLLVVLPLRVRAKTPPGGPSNTGVWVQTRPPQYWTSASCECDAYGNFEYDGEGWPPVQGPTFGAAKVASASVSGANAQADSTALLAVNPAGQTVMQSMFTLTDSVIGNVTEDEYGYYVTAATAGTLSVQGTLSTSAPDVLAQARVDIVWGGGFGGDDSADRHVDIRDLVRREHSYRGGRGHRRARICERHRRQRQLVRKGLLYPHRRCQRRTRGQPRGIRWVRAEWHPRIDNGDNGVRCSGGVRATLPDGGVGILRDAGALGWVATLAAPAGPAAPAALAAAGPGSGSVRQEWWPSSGRDASDVARSAGHRRENTPTTSAGVALKVRTARCRAADRAITRSAAAREPYKFLASIGWLSERLPRYQWVPRLRL
jgi:hypothetical protein